MKNLFISNKRILILCTLLISSFTVAQTSEIGSYEIYTRATSRTAVGYLNTRFELPVEFGYTKFIQHGISLTQNYDFINITSEAIGNESHFKLFIEGVFSIGAAVEEKTLPSDQNSYPKNTVKYYVGTAELFSLYLVPEWAQIIGHGNSIHFNIGINLLNIGGTVGYLEDGTFEENAIGTINIVPFAIKPSIIFDLGGAGFGFSFYYNPFNILTYNIAPKELYPDQQGFQSMNSFVEKYEFRILIAY